MPIKKGKDTDSKRDISVSFRVSSETKKRLDALAVYSGYSQADVITTLIKDEYRRISRESPNEIKLVKDKE